MLQQKTRTFMKTMDAYGLTPTILFNRLKGERKFLFETSSSHVSIGRYSIFGANPRKTYYGFENTLYEYVYENEQTYTYTGDLLQLLKQVMPQISNEMRFPFTGGAVGYIRYNRQKSDLPAAHFHIYDIIYVFDHITEQLSVIHTNIQPEIKEIDLDACLQQLLDYPIKKSTYTCSSAQPFVAPSSFDLAIRNIQQQLSKEEITKLVIATKYSATFDGDPFAYYRAFRKTAASPYQYFIDCDDYQLFGSSDQRIVAVKNRTVQSDQAATKNSFKNPHVLQTNGNFSGQLCDHLEAIDALALAVPAEEFIGTPFDRAHAFLEKTALDERILFGGAVGYIGFNGNLDFAHAHNSVIVKDKEAFIEKATIITPKTIQPFKKKG